MNYIVSLIITHALINCTAPSYVLFLMVIPGHKVSSASCFVLCFILSVRDEREETECLMNKRFVFLLEIEFKHEIFSSFGIVIKVSNGITTLHLTVLNVIFQQDVWPVQSMKGFMIRVLT